MRTITIVAHAGVVTSLAGLFFGILAWANNSPYGLPMSLGSVVLLALSGAVGWYYGFSYVGWAPLRGCPTPENVGLHKVQPNLRSCTGLSPTSDA
ncbi:MAG TPA: hypothetical protein VGX03_32440 [Candidatus Binatia bacterium]|nr:hypothetical protein [Candidatus Binatia bacterium]